MTSFYSEEELRILGIKSYGNNVLISRKASLYSPQNITIGNNVRVDDFCILSGKIILKDYIHISAYCALYGAMGIEMENYTGLSPRCTVFSASDDFSGDFLTNPMVEKNKTNITGGKVLIKQYSQIGASCTILPSITIEEGVSTGAMSLINKDLHEWGIYAGIPVKRIKDRKKGLLSFV